MTKVSHNFLCSLFLFDFEVKRCYARSFATNNGELVKYSKEVYSNDSSNQGLCPRTHNHVINVGWHYYANTINFTCRISKSDLHNRHAELVSASHCCIPCRDYDNTLCKSMSYLFIIFSRNDTIKNPDINNLLVGAFIYSNFKED